MSRETLRKAFDETLPGLGFKSRPEQFQYAMMVQEKLDLGADVKLGGGAVGKAGDIPGSRPVFGAIEAGTGTGKTLGYLIPVLLHIAETGGCARITTHTLALQDQIYGRDAVYADRQPDFSRGDRSDMAVALEVVDRVTGNRLTSGFRKGRQAYLSPMAVFELVDAGKVTGVKRHKEDAALLNDLWEWAMRIQALRERQDELFKAGASQNGVMSDAVDRLKADLEADSMQGLIASFMDAHDGRLPSGITAAEIGMVPTVNDNPFHRHHAGNSMDRDVLVVSHTLSLFDLQMGEGSLLPPAKVVVHDEADTLAGVAEMYSRKKIRPDLLRNALRKAFGGGSPDPVQSLDSLLTKILHWFSAEYDQRNPVDSNGEPLLETPVSEVMLDDKTPITTSVLGYLGMLRQSVVDVLALKVPEDATLDVLRFFAVLKRVRQELSLAENAFPANTEFGTRQLSLDENGLPKKGKESVHLALGLTWTPVKKFPAFEVVNLYASRMFGKEWFFKSEKLETVLLTSATLQTPAAKNGKSNEWTYMYRLLGMPEAAGREVSVKRFGSIQRIHLMKSDATPFLDKGNDGEIRYDPEWVDGVHLMLADMLKTGERGLVLTSSFKDVKTIMEGFTDRRIWWQTDSKEMHWQDGVEAMRRGDCQIMVTPSVWAGANIRDERGGQLFRHQGILRAPIGPGDAVREKALANYFRWKGLDNRGDPDDVARHAVLRMADQAGKHKMTQGLGRGIRSAGDVIEVWLMDPRLGQAQWQATFPKRFRGLFADPAVLHLVDVRPDQGAPEAGKKIGRLAQMKKNLPPKRPGHNDSKGEPRYDV
ncbi:MAG: helicase C-terminal domain-containing protein [Acidithiobacillus sp.]